jgi:hypothetical protein
VIPFSSISNIQNTTAKPCQHAKYYLLLQSIPHFSYQVYLITFFVPVYLFVYLLYLIILHQLQKLNIIKGKREDDYKSQVGEHKTKNVHLLFQVL